METIAVYRESRIRTYGFQRIPDLALIQLSCTMDTIQSLGEILSEPTLHIKSASFMAVQGWGQEISLVFCVPVEEVKGLDRALKKISRSIKQDYIYPVGIIFFHGPHFGDRYGIADTTFSCLAKAKIRVIASGCSSSSVYLVFAQNDIDRAEGILAQTFEVAQ